MARGILAGVTHGALIGAAALAALSLALPLPQGRSPEASARGSLSVDLPVGSEFGRGGDLAPTLPAPNAAGPRAPTRPVAVPLPASEPAPVTVTGDTARPEMLADERMPTPSLPATTDATPDVTRPATTPATPMIAIPQPHPGAGQDAPPRIAPEAAAPSDTTPAMPAPALDLSLPPDLTDLRRLEGN